VERLSSLPSETILLLLDASVDLPRHIYHVPAHSVFIAAYSIIMHNL